MKYMIRLASLGALVLATTACGVSVHKTSATKPPHNKKPSVARVLRWSKAPKMSLHAGEDYTATVSTSEGSFVIHLFSHKSPVAVNNFVFLARHHYFDNNQFFRVLAPFVVQTGDPTNTGKGGPGYQWKAELPPPYPYATGIVAMAIAPGQVNSNGSQFFICTGNKSQSLNQQPDYTELGRVTHGWSTVKTIAGGAVRVNPSTHEDSQPVHPDRILNVVIHTSPRSSA